MANMVKISAHFWMMPPNKKETQWTRNNQILPINMILNTCCLFLCCFQSHFVSSRFSPSVLISYSLILFSAPASSLRFLSALCSLFRNKRSFSRLTLSVLNTFLSISSWTFWDLQDSIVLDRKLRQGPAIRPVIDTLVDTSQSPQKHRNEPVK